MYCSNCGKQIPDEVKFCPECGGSTSTENKPRKNKMLYCAIAALCLTLGLGVYWLHTEVERQRKENLESAEKASEAFKRTNEKLREMHPSLGTIDLNYKLPEPNSSQSE